MGGILRSVIGEIPMNEREYAGHVDEKVMWQRTVTNMPKDVKQKLIDSSWTPLGSIFLITYQCLDYCLHIWNMFPDHVTLNFSTFIQFSTLYKLLDINCRIP